MQAAPYDGSDALEDFHAWVENHPRIQDACQSIGGWERWAQIDFAAWLHAQGTETLLEDHCFVNGEARNDLTIWPVGNGGGAGGACLELKVFNNGADNQATYRAKVLGDQLKLENNALNALNAGLEKVSIALASVDHLLVFLRLQYPDEDVNQGNMVAFLDQYFGAYSHEIIQSQVMGGIDFVVSFLRVNYM